MSKGGVDGIIGFSQVCACESVSATQAHSQGGECIGGLATAACMSQASAVCHCSGGGVQWPRGCMGCSGPEVDACPV